MRQSVQGVVLWTCILAPLNFNGGRNLMKSTLTTSNVEKKTLTRGLPDRCHLGMWAELAVPNQCSWQLELCAVVSYWKNELPKLSFLHRFPGLDHWSFVLLLCIRCHWVVSSNAAGPIILPHTPTGQTEELQRVVSVSAQMIMKNRKKTERSDPFSLYPSLN